MKKNETNETNVEHVDKSDECIGGSCHDTSCPLEPPPKTMKQVKHEDEKVKHTVFTCWVCDHTSSYFPDFQTHLATHNCHETFVSKDETNETKTLIFRCKCGTECMSRTTLWRHKKKCVPKKKNVRTKQPSQIHAIVSMDSHEKSCASETMFHCECGMDCNSRTTFWRHKKKCPMEIEYKDLFAQMMDQNKEFKLMLMEQNKQILELSKNQHQQQHQQHQQQQHQQQQQQVINVVNNYADYSNKTINHNKFNLNMFLNEQCKDALNISDFVDSLQITMDDLENMGTLGFVKGISQIFVTRLKELDVCKRPIHCSDLKREVMHVKENNVWEKEDGTGTRHNLIGAIKKIADKNLKTLPQWKQNNPECRDSESKKSDQYLQMMTETLGSCDKDVNMANYNKIIKNLAKEVTIEKKTN